MERKLETTDCKDIKSGTLTAELPADTSKIEVQSRRTGYSKSPWLRVQLPKPKVSVELRPDGSRDATAYCEEGRKLLDAGKPGLAEKALEKAVSCDAGHARALFLLGRARWVQIVQLEQPDPKRFEAALAYQRLISVFPDPKLYPLAWVGVGYYWWFDQGDACEAKEYLGKGLEALNRSDDPDTYRTVEGWYGELGRRCSGH